jgi:predicted transcriptional regulator
LNKELNKVAAALDRPKSWLIEQAINDYVKLQKWQVAAIEEGIRQADAGNLIPHEEAIAWMRSLATRRELPMPKSKSKKK